MKSSLVDCEIMSPNCTKPRSLKIDRITPHCAVSKCTAEALGNYFKNTAVKASANYGIGVDGKIGLYVDEDNRSWCSSNRENDNRSITIECASDVCEPYEMTEKVCKSLILLCYDICKRYGKTKLLWIEDKDKALAYAPNPDEMLITVHRWFANKSCPGDWLYSRLGELAKLVTEELKPATYYTVQLGAFNDFNNALIFRHKLEVAGFNNAFIKSVKL